MSSPALGSSHKNLSSPGSQSTTGHQLNMLNIEEDQAEQLQSENAKLSSQLKEVIKMNSHWQRYDKQREEHVLKLTNDNEELQDRVKSMEPQLQELLKENAMLKDANHKRGRDAIEHDEDDDRPRELLASSHSYEEKRISSLTHQITILKKRNHELEIRKSSKTGEEEKDVQIAMLREQINVCVEDFRQERKDRERIHAENGKLLQRLAAAEQRTMALEEQMYAYQEKFKPRSDRHNPVSRPVPMNVFDEPCRYPEDRSRYQSNPSQARNTYRRHPYNVGEDFMDLPSDVEIDGEKSKDQRCTGPSPQVTYLTTLNKVNAEEPLECPRCLAAFAIHKHADLLAHINKCLQ